MKKIIRKLSKRNKFTVVLYLLTILAYIVSFSIFTKNVLSLKDIETLVRYIILALFAVYFINFVLANLLRIIERRYKKFYISFSISLFFIIIFILGSLAINFVYSGISSFGESETIVYSQHLITLTDDELEEEDNIGIISSDDDNHGNDLSTKLIEAERLSNKILTYDDYVHMLTQLYEGKIDAALVPGTYLTLYSNEEGFENIASETEIIATYSEEQENKDITITSTKDFDEPLTFLIMGVDSETDGLNANAAFNGDTLMMVTFNPKTLNATMFSIPRDTLVPIACRSNTLNKINSSAAYGTECVIDTVENFTGITVDYYVKINFKGVVDLVDAIGGITVDVEEPDIDTYDGQVCEQNSDRQFGDELICMDSGIQHLDGEQALAYARNRKLYLTSDLARTQHQQQVVEAIANQLLTLSSIEDFEKVFDTVDKNIVSNMQPEQIFSAYNVMKDIVFNSISGNGFVSIEKSYLEVYSLRVWIESSQRESETLGYYKDSLEDIKQMMEINLGLKEDESTKTFSFSANEYYEPVVAGDGYVKERTEEVLSNYVGSNKSDAQSFCTKNGISCTFETVDSDDENYNMYVSEGLIGAQSVHEKVLLSTIDKITFYLVGENLNKEDEEDEPTENNEEKPEEEKPEEEKPEEDLEPEKEPESDVSSSDNDSLE